MRLLPLLAAAVMVPACGQSDEQQLENAANQSDPAAAAVLDNAAENGTDPQQALQDAGNAAATANAAMNPRPMEARPNSADQPNPPQPGQPPEKVPANTTE